MLILHTLRITAALAMIFTTGLTIVTTASAQDSPIDLLEYLDGLESAYSRRYMSADALAIDPLATPAPSEDPSSAMVVDATVLEFAEASDVTFAFTTVMNDEIARTIMGEPDIEFAVSNPVDLGDRAHFYMGPTEDGGEYAVAGLLIVQDGNLGFMISGVGSDESIAHTLRDFGTFMIEAEPGTDEAEADDYGFLTGGMFNLLPSIDNPGIIRQLRPMYDYDLLVSTSPIEGAATPGE